MPSRKQSRSGFDYAGGGGSARGGGAAPPPPPHPSTYPGSYSSYPPTYPTYQTVGHYQPGYHGYMNG